MSTSNESQDFEIILKKLRTKEAWKNISGSHKIQWSMKILNKFADKLDWSELCENCNVLWTEDMIESFKDHIDWYLISKNIFANRYKQSQKEKDWNLLKKYESYWNWDELSSYSESIPLNVLQQFADKWNWRNLIYNISIDWSSEFYESLKQYIPTKDFYWFKDSVVWDSLVEIEESVIISGILEE